MVELGGLLLVSISVGLSNLAGAMGIGLAGVNARMRIRVAVAFGLFETLMPILGLLAGRTLAGELRGYGRYVGAALLVATGIYTVVAGLRAGQEGRRTITGRALVLTALALSFDNLVVGFALGVYHVNLVLAGVLIGTISVAMSLLGLQLGQRLGGRVEQWSDELGGIVLVLVGVALAAGLI